MNFPYLTLALEFNINYIITMSLHSTLGMSAFSVTMAQVYKGSPLSVKFISTGANYYKQTPTIWQQRQLTPLHPTHTLPKTVVCTKYAAMPDMTKIPRWPSILLLAVRDLSSVSSDFDILI
jgi:hypothetical protein